MTRVLFPLLVGLAVYYAVFGGEYDVFEVRQTRAAIAEERAEVERLRVRIDSMRARADSLEHDAHALERLARERFGMIRDGEVLYRFVEPREEPEG